MDTAQITVTVGGVALVGFILWFFFGPRRATAARESGTPLGAYYQGPDDPLPFHPSELGARTYWDLLLPEIRRLADEPR